MKLRALVLISSLVAVSEAHAESPSLRLWTDSILSRLPFVAGELDRNRYAAHANSFVEDKIAYFDGVFGRLMAKATKHGMTARADALREDHDRRIRDLTVNVDTATEALFAALDPDGDGVINRAQARDIVFGFATAADLNNDGILDTDEQRLAEWALSTGNVIADKTDDRTLRRQFREMDRVVW